MRETQGLHFVHTRAGWGGCFAMAVHAHSYGADGKWLPRGDFVSDALRNRGVWEWGTPSDLEALSHAPLPMRGTFLDVGAHVGFHAFSRLDLVLRVELAEGLPPQARDGHARLPSFLFSL